MKFVKIILILFIVALIGLRLYLPTFLKHYVENQINKIPEYRLTIKDIDVHLIAGSYTMQGVQLWKVPKQLPVPYIAADSINFAIEWAAIFKSKLVAKVTVQKPIINFVDDPQDKNQQLSIDARWVDLVKTLFPLNINRFDAHDGEIYFRSYKGNPPFSNYIKDIEFTMQNMQNANRSSVLLPSEFSFTGVPMGKGQIKIDGKFNPFNKQPTFSLQANLTSLQVARIAKLIKHYVSVNVVGGQFSLYGEAAAANGRIQGYVKPFLKNLKIGNAKNESPIGGIVNGIATVAAKILQDSKTKTIATKINLSGSINDPDSSILSIIGYLIQHGFIRSLLPQIDHTIGIEDVIYGKPLDSKSKFPRYRN